MTSRSFSCTPAAALIPHPMEVLGALGYVPAPKQLFNKPIEFLVLIGNSTPRVC
jgi:hypothetical protein